MEKNKNNIPLIIILALLLCIAILKPAKYIVDETQHRHINVFCCTDAGVKINKLYSVKRPRLWSSEIEYKTPEYKEAYAKNNFVGPVNVVLEEDYVKSILHYLIPICIVITTGTFAYFVFGNKDKIYNVDIKNPIDVNVISCPKIKKIP